MYESVAPTSGSLRSLSGQLTDLRPLPQASPQDLDPPCVLAGAVRTLTDYLFRGVGPFVFELDEVYGSTMRPQLRQLLPSARLEAKCS